MKKAKSLLMRNIDGSLTHCDVVRELSTGYIVKVPVIVYFSWWPWPVKVRVLDVVSHDDKNVVNVISK